MNTRSHKALVINGFWATVFAGLVSAILGGSGFAWSVYADTTTLKEQVAEVKKAELPSRMDRLEVNVAAGFSEQNRLLEKVDKRLERIEQGLQDGRRAR